MVFPFSFTVAFRIGTSRLQRSDWSRSVVMPNAPHSVFVISRLYKYSRRSCGRRSTAFAFIIWIFITGKHMLHVLMIGNNFIVITSKIITIIFLCTLAGVSCNRCGIRIFFTETKSSATNIAITIVLGAYKPWNRQYW